MPANCCFMVPCFRSRPLPWIYSPKPTVLCPWATRSNKLGDRDGNRTRNKRSSIKVQAAYPDKSKHYGAVQKHTSGPDTILNSRVSVINMTEVFSCKQQIFSKNYKTWRAATRQTGHFLNIKKPRPATGRGFECICLHLNYDFSVLFLCWACPCLLPHFCSSERTYLSRELFCPYQILFWFSIYPLKFISHKKTRIVRPGFQYLYSNKLLKSKSIYAIWIKIQTFLWNRFFYMSHISTHLFFHLRVRWSEMIFNKPNIISFLCNNFD